MFETWMLISTLPWQPNDEKYEEAELLTLSDIRSWLVCITGHFYLYISVKNEMVGDNGCFLCWLSSQECLWKRLWRLSKLWLNIRLMSPSQWCLCTNAFSRALTFRGQIYKEIIAVQVRFLHQGLSDIFVKLHLLITVFSTTEESIFQYHKANSSADRRVHGCRFITDMDGDTTVTRGWGNGQRVWLRWGQVLTASSTLKWENFMLERNAYNVIVWQIQMHKPHSYH